MVSQVSGRNNKLISEGRLNLHLKSGTALPYDDSSLDKVCAMNVFHLWDNPEDDLREIQRVLKDDGILVLCIRMAEEKQGFMTSPGFTMEEFDRTVNFVREAGFTELDIVTKNIGREIRCIVA